MPPSRLTGSIGPLIRVRSLVQLQLAPRLLAWENTLLGRANGSGPCIGRHRSAPLRPGAARWVGDLWGTGSAVWS
jgi:hypothetical protein